MKRLILGLCVVGLLVGSLSEARAIVAVLPTVTTNVAGVFNPGSGLYRYDQTFNNLTPGFNIYIPVSGTTSIIPVSINFAGYTNKTGWSSPANPAYTLNANDNTLFPLLAIFNYTASSTPVVFDSVLPPTALPFGIRNPSFAPYAYVDPLAPIPEPGSALALGAVAAGALVRRRRR